MVSYHSKWVAGAGTSVSVPIEYWMWLTLRSIGHPNDNTSYTLGGYADVDLVLDFEWYGRVAQTFGRAIS